MTQEIRTVKYDAELKVEAYHFQGIMQKFPNHFHEYYVIGFIEKGHRYGKQVLYVYTKTGQLAELKDWNGTTSFRYDALSRLQEVTDHNNRTTKYQYDGAGNITALTYPDASVVSYKYNAQNLPVMVTDADGSSTTFAYNPAGNLLLQTNPSGEIMVHTYNSLGQLIRTTESINGKTQRANTYVYDERGNISGETQTGQYAAFNKTKTYEYDTLNRLVTAAENDTTTRYEYDSLGNLTRETTDGQVTVYTYNQLNQLLTKTTPAQAFTYQYFGVPES